VIPQAVSRIFQMCFLAACVAPPAMAEGAAGWKEAVLDANEAFYDAFRNGDLSGMEKVWGSREPIILDHPQGELFDGRKAVMDYWEWTLPGASLDVSCDVTGVARTATTVTVYCDEYLFHGAVKIKNIFHKEDGEWKMIYHGPPQQQGLS